MRKGVKDVVSMDHVDLELLPADQWTVGNMSTRRGAWA